MSKLPLIGLTTGLLCAFTVLCPAAETTKREAASVPNFAPDPSTAWTSDRPQSDDFLPPVSGPGPVLSDKAHPYVPNGQGQPTYRIADLTNPILKPWLIERMHKANEDVRAGKVPFIAAPVPSPCMAKAKSASPSRQANVSRARQTERESIAASN